MEAYWVQYREHCVEQVEKFLGVLESLEQQQTALAALDGNPAWIASLGRDIVDARHALEVYQAVIAKLDSNDQPTG
jgi:hypothetical protein